MHLAFHPAFPNPVLLRGWGGLRGVGYTPGYDDPVTRRGWGGMWGLGAGLGQQSGTTIASEAGAAAAATGTLLASMAAPAVGTAAAAAGGGALAVLPASFAAAGPIGMAVGAAVAIGVALAKIFSGCGQTCVAATAIANQVEPLLAQNRDNYLGTPVRYKSFQAAALNNFDLAWNALVRACSDPNLQDAGKRCISDRQRGSCKWKTSEGQGCPSGVNSCWTQDASGNCTFHKGGAAGSGNACFDWFIGYRDPIANDPCVQPDPTQAQISSGQVDQQVASSTSSVTTPSSNMTPILLIGGAALLLFMAMGSSS